MMIQLTSDRILNVTDVCAITHLSRPTIYRYCKSKPPKFPPPRELGGHRIGWLVSEVTAWLQSRETPIAYRSDPAKDTVAATASAKA